MAKLVDLNTLAYFATLVRDYINDCFLRQKKGVEIGWFDFGAIVPDPPLENMNDAFIRFSEIGKVFAGSVSEWDSEKTDYQIGDWVTYNKALWRLTDNYSSYSGDDRIPGATKLWATPSVSIPNIEDENKDIENENEKDITLKSLGEYCDAIKESLKDFITKTNENIETLRGGINTLNTRYNGLTTLHHVNCESVGYNASNLHLEKRGCVVVIHGYINTPALSASSEIAKIPDCFDPSCHTPDGNDSYVTIMGFCPNQKETYAIDVKKGPDDRYYLIMNKENAFPGGNLYINGSWMIKTIEELKNDTKVMKLIPGSVIK